MRKLAALALIALLGGAWYIIRDPGHVPLFDAGLQRLAENGGEGYCAGVTFWQSYPGPDAKKAAGCRAERGYDGPVTELEAVLPAFCRAVTDQGYQGGVETCLEIVERDQLWPTYDGTLTNNWSESAPWPLDLAFTAPPTDSRTGTRDGFSRDDQATTTTTSESTTTEGDN